MIDIKNLNDLIISNIYFISLQINIIIKLFKYIYLLIFDIISFFYQ